MSESDKPFVCPVHGCGQVSVRANRSLTSNSLLGSRKPLPSSDTPCTASLGGFEFWSAPTQWHHRQPCL